MKILVLSDTHKLHRDANFSSENVDLIIHAGDAADSYDISKNTSELEDFLFWFDSLPIKHKVFVPGNHDLALERKKIDLSRWNNIHFLIDEMVEIEYEVGTGVWDKLKIYGSPWTPPFGQKQWAWTMKREKLSNHWNSVPECDILVTHGPPFGILDVCSRHGKNAELAGDKALLNRVREIKPKLHIFGHIHDQGGGIPNFGIRKWDGIKFINASLKSDFGTILNTPIQIDTKPLTSDFSTTQS